MTAITKTSLRSLPNTAPLEDIRAIYEDDGGLIIENFLTAEQVSAFNAETDAYVAAQIAGRKKREGDLAQLVDFHGDNTKRTRNLVNRSKTFREEILNRDLLHAVAEGGLLGPPPCTTFPP